MPVVLVAQQVAEGVERVVMEFMALARQEVTVPVVAALAVLDRLQVLVAVAVAVVVVPLAVLAVLALQIPVLAVAEGVVPLAVLAVLAVRVVPA